MDRGQSIAVAVMAPQLFFGVCMIMLRRRLPLSSGQQEPTWHGSGGDAAAAMLLFFSMVFVLPGLVAPFFTEEWSPTLSEFIGSCALAIFAVTVLRRGYFSLHLGCSPRHMSFAKSFIRGALWHLRAAPPIFLAGIIWVKLLSILSTIGLPLSLEQQDIVLAMGDTSPVAAAIAAIASVSAVPIGEEILFRGTIHRYLKSRMGFRRGAVVGSLIFAILHGNLCALMPLFVLSLIISLAYEYEGNLIPCVVMHAIFNGSGAALAIFAGH